MFEINELCLQKFKPDDPIITVISRDKPYIPEQEGIFPQVTFSCSCFHIFCLNEELLNKYNPGGLPQHTINLKIGCSLMLIRNVNLYEGLANGTRLRLLSVSDSRKVMKVEIMTGPKAKINPATGKHHFSLAERTFPLFMIPNANENDRCMKMIRKQFPIRLTYCMSINKAQGTN